MARRNWPDHGGNPRYGLSAPGSPWVQELDGPVRIKALLIADPYFLGVNMDAMTTTRRRRRAALGAIVLVAALALNACGGSDDAGNPDSRLSEAQATAPLEDAPAPLAAVRSQANQLLDGGADAFDRRLEELRGFPIVVNKWASWCGPCRLEFPWFQSVASERGDEIAFLGVDTDDSESAAGQFLSELPLPYPSYSDPNFDIAEKFEGPPQAFPATAFYDRTGELVFTRPGVYPDEQELIADVERYAR
jgi:cytochrome c biogenesis protein CcmG, thiol:disulfide interchange protein DsbE